MESVKIENLTFKYPDTEKEALSDISLCIDKGEFVTLCGKSGCGKTTLLRLLKPALSPFGEKSGNILFEGTTVNELDEKEQASKIGFVLQNPDSQIVTDKVWHELSFGLESLGTETSEIRIKVAEMSSYFGIENWFHKNVSELSGGQKQMLNLASVMVMQPELLILDEPLSQLDPIAAQEFIKTLEKINRELGTTIILSEHRLEDAFAVSDKIIVMDKGKIIAQGKPGQMGHLLKDNDMFLSLPAPTRIYQETEGGEISPVTVREGKKWLESFAKEHQVKDISRAICKENKKEIAVELKEVYFRYEKNAPDVIKNLNVNIHKGEFFAILGGNGSGKSTAVSIMSGINVPYSGKVKINGISIKKAENLYNGVLGVLPQNPQTLFVKKTVYLDLLEFGREEQIQSVAKLCGITEVLNRHPFDLSGGEMQRVALAKILLKNPQIIIMDEPTKGMDAHFKKAFARIITSLKKEGVTIVVVSHDVEFCAENADRCALFFDGNLVSVKTPGEFFADKNFYTTSSGRMTRGILKNGILAKDVIDVCQKAVKGEEK